MTIPLEDFLSASWQKQRAGDNLDSIYWLYNRTGQPWLLDLARVNHERTDDWSGGIASWHNVNFAECFREPAQFFQQAKDRAIPERHGAQLRHHAPALRPGPRRRVRGR